MSNLHRALIVPHGFEANYVLGFVKGLVANQVELCVISDDDLAPHLDAADIPHLNLRGNLSPHRSVWRKLYNLLAYYSGLLRQVVRHRGSTIHFVGLLNSRLILFDGLALPLWFRLWAARYVHTAHNALPHRHRESRLFHLIYWWIYRCPHMILAHTERLATQLKQDFGVPESRLAVISIGLNEEVANTTLTSVAARQHLGLPASNPIALFFGKVEPYKGVDLLPEVWQRIQTPEALLSIVGWCQDPSYAVQIRNAIAQSSSAPSISWREGFVPNEEVALWLRACDLVVMPYRHIYQSGVVFLCLRFGVPIVATNVGSLPEFIDEASGIIAGSNDSAGLARAIDDFFSRRSYFDRAEIARGAQRFRWDRQCALIRHLYPPNSSPALSPSSE